MNLPYNSERYYLSGMDWIIGALNDYMLSTGAAGNHSSLIITLAGHIPERIITSRIIEALTEIPLLSGRLKRDFANLAPFWKPGKAGGERGAVLETVPAESDAELSEILAERLNRRFQKDDEHIAFLLVRKSDHDVLIMTFDHRILDARGAESFLHLLADGGLESVGRIKTTDAPELREWSAKFAAGREIQREIIRMSKLNGCRAFMDGRVGRLANRPELKTAFQALTESETSKFDTVSERIAGYMMETVYLLAVSALTLYKLGGSREREWFFVPVPIDLRGRGGDPLRETLFNHFSFLFFHIEITPDSTVVTLACDIRRQLLARIAEEFPEKMADASRLGRIFPFWLNRRFMRLPFDGKMASFVFANVGDSDAPDDVCGVKVDVLLHMPRIPSPPGLGVFFNRFNGRLNLTVTGDEANLDMLTANDAAKEIAAALRN